MAEEFQTTFIPKQGIAPSPSQLSLKKKATSIITLITFVIFILSAVAGGYIYARQLMIKGDIEEITAEIRELSSTLEDDTIKDITALSDRLKLSKKLLDEHLASSEVFTVLETYTLPSVGFTSFSYAYSDEMIKLSGSGKAAGFGSIVLQSDAYGDSKYLRDVIFSNLQNNPETGVVTFNFEAKLEPSVVLFKNAIKTDGSDLLISDRIDESSQASLEEEIINEEEK